MSSENRLNYFKYNQINLKITNNLKICKNFNSQNYLTVKSLDQKSTNQEFGSYYLAVYNEENISTSETNFRFTHRSIRMNKPIENLNNIRISKQEYIMMKYWKLWKNYTKNKKNSAIRLEVCINKKTKPQKSENKKIKIKFDNKKLNLKTDGIKFSNKIPPENQETRLSELMLETKNFTKESLEILKESVNNSDKKLKDKFINYCIKKDNQNPIDKYKNNWESVMKMEERAKQRKEKWEIIRQNKKRLEEEKQMRINMKNEEEKKQIDIEKKKKILEFKIEKEKQEELRRKRAEEREYFQSLEILAAEHYKRKLLIKGIEELKNNVEYNKNALQKAEEFFCKNLLFKYFWKWKFIYNITMRNKIFIAETFYKNHLLKTSFKQFKIIYLKRIEKYEKAAEIYEFSLKKNTYYSWKCYTYKKIYETNKRQQEMLQYYERNLMKRCIECWKNLKQILFDEREKEQRLRSWRAKVQDALPDFEPIL